MYKITNSVADRLLLEKIARFIFHLSKIDEKEKSKFLSENIQDDNKRKKVNSLILQILNKNDENDKIPLYSKTFSMFLNDFIGYNEFIVAFKKISQSSSVSLNFLGEFSNLKTKKISNYSLLELEQTIQEGLIKQYLIGGGDANGNISSVEHLLSHELTETGLLLLEIINH